MEKMVGDYFREMLPVELHRIGRVLLDFNAYIPQDRPRYEDVFFRLMMPCTNRR